MEIRNKLHIFIPLNKKSIANRRSQPHEYVGAMKKKLTEQGRENIRYWVNRARKIAGPDEIVDLVSLATKAGIKIKRGNFNNEFSGMLTLKGSRFTIHLNIAQCGKLSSPMSRYTLAHELGHFFIFSHKARLLTGEGTCEKGYILVDDGLAEKEAEYFASCLLMPEEHIVPLFESAPLSHHLLWDIAAHFKVSLTAVTGRYAVLGPTPILMVWSNKGKYEKANKSKDFPFFNLNTSHDNKMPDCCSAANLNLLNGSNETLLQTLPARNVLKSSRPIPEDMQLIEFSYFMHRPTGKMLSVFWEKGCEGRIEE